MDVAWNVPVDFWEALRPKLEAVKGDIVMPAEAHQADLIPKAFDLDCSWPLYHATAAVVQEGKSASTVREEWQKERATYPRSCSRSEELEVGPGSKTAGNAVALPAVSLDAWGYRIFRRVTPR